MFAIWQRRSISTAKCWGCRRSPARRSVSAGPGLHLIEDTPPQDTPPQDTQRQAFHFALLVADATAAAQMLRGRDITLVSGPAPRPDGAIQVFVRDPDGYLLEMVSAPHNAGNPTPGPGI